VAESSRIVQPLRIYVVYGTMPCSVDETDTSGVYQWLFITHDEIVGLNELVQLAFALE